MATQRRLVVEKIRSRRQAIIIVLTAVLIGGGLTAIPLGWPLFAIAGPGVGALGVGAGMVFGRRVRPTIPQRSVVRDLVAWLLGDLVMVVTVAVADLHGAFVVLFLCLGVFMGLLHTSPIVLWSQEES